MKKQSARDRFLESLYIPQEPPFRQSKQPSIPKGTDADCNELVDELNKIFNELFGGSDGDDE